MQWSGLHSHPIQMHFLVLSSLMCRYHRPIIWYGECGGVCTHQRSRSYTSLSMACGSGCVRKYEMIARQQWTGNGHAIPMRPSECMCHIFYSYFTRTIQHNYARASRLASARILFHVFFASRANIEAWMLVARSTDNFVIIVNLFPNTFLECWNRFYCV